MSLVPPTRGMRLGCKAARPVCSAVRQTEADSHLCVCQRFRAHHTRYGGQRRLFSHYIPPVLALEPTSFISLIPPVPNLPCFLLCY